MSQINLELPIARVDETYSNSFTFLAARRAKRLGYKNGAALLAEVYKSFDPEMSSEVLELLSVQRTSCTFIKKYNIRYKEDILFVIRHPEHQKDEEDIDENNNYRKIIVFDTETWNSDEQAALEFFQGLKRRDRFSVFNNMLNQFCITSDNSYFFNHKATHLFTYLREHIDLSSNQLPEEIQHYIDMIWMLGRDAVQN